MDVLWRINPKFVELEKKNDGHPYDGKGVELEFKINKGPAQSLVSIDMEQALVLYSRLQLILKEKSVLI